MSPQFTTIGELLVDFTPVIEDGATVGFRIHPGGSPSNVAVGLARLGARVDFAAKVSTDFFGRFLVAHLENEGVGTRFLSRSAEPSTLAFVAIQDDEPSFSFYVEGTADTRLLPSDLPDTIAETDVLHFGGISLLREPTSSTIEGLVETLRGRAMLSCDPNIRLALITDAPSCRDRLTRLMRKSDIVKLSAEDLHWLDPDRSMEAAAVSLLERGPRLAVVTQGATGAYARAGFGEVRVSARPVEVVDTVGAGDAFTSGLLFALAEHGVATRLELERLGRTSLEDSLRFAAAAAALTCTRSGADPPRYQEVQRFL